MAVVNLFQYLPGLEASADEILEAELLATQLLKAKYPDIDVREGTAIRDLVVRPSATLLALVKKSISLYFDQNTISGVTDTTNSEFVDKLISNWFLTRKLGNKAVINARLFFAKSKTVTLLPEVYFSPDNEKKYYPVSVVTFSPDQLTYVATTNQWYVDVDLIAETESVNYNVSSGSLLYFSNFDPYFLHAEINFLRTEANNSETNSEFVQRAKDAISTRNLINVPSINSNLLEAFPLLDGVLPIGFGDSEMVRDQIKIIVPDVADPVWIHNGGCVDVYCRTKLTSSIVQLTTNSSGVALLTGGVYKFERSSISGSDADDTIPVLQLQNVNSITQTGGTATVTTTVAHGYTTGQKVTIQGANQSGYNLPEVSITVTGLNTFTYSVAASTVSPATGTIQCGIDYPYTWSNQAFLTVTPTSITRSGTTATVTYADHGLMPGERVMISGANQPDYNGVIQVLDAPTKDTFTYTVLNSPATPATGTLSVKYVERQKEVGMSDRQVLEIDFGVGNANKTASFYIYYYEGLDGIQEYLSDASRRILCGDLLARGLNLTLLDITITSYDTVAPSATIANDVIKEYLLKLEPGRPFIMSDLLAKLYAAGITTIQTPLTVTYIRHFRDHLNTVSGTITDVMDPNDTTNIFFLNSVTTEATTIA